MPTYQPPYLIRLSKCRRVLGPLVLVLLLLPGALRAAAPALPFTARTYNVAQGLPSRGVRALWAAPSGALWVGTVLGVARFDGTGFYQPVGLTDVVCYALAGQGDDYLWIGDQEGVRRLDLRTGAVRAWPRPDPAGTAQLDQQVRAALVSRDGAVYVGTESGWLLRYDPARGRFRRLARVPGATPDRPARLIGLAEDAAGRLWCSTAFARGAYRFDPRARTLRLYPDRPTPVGQPAPFPSVRVAVDARGHVAANFSGQGLARYQPTADRFRPLGPRPPDAEADFYQPTLHLDAQGHYWFGRWRPTLQSFDPATGDTLDVSRALGITGTAQCLLPDGAGGLWVGSGDGLHHLSPRPAVFTTLLTRSPALPLSQRFSLRGLAELTDGRLLLAGYQGLRLLGPPSGAAPVPVLAPTDRLRNLFAYALLPDSADRGAWLATEGGGLGWLNLLTGTVWLDLNRRDDHGRPVTPFGRALLPGPDGSLWLGTYEGLFRITQPGTAAARYHRATSRAWPETQELDCFALVRRGNDLWVGARQGLYCFDARTGKVVRRLRPGSVRPPVRALWAEPGATGALWLGTAGGLVRVDPAARPGHQLQTYDERAGLSNNVVMGLLPDGADGLWVSTNNGLTRLDLRTRACQRFLPADGLSAAEFNHGSALRTRDGQLLFGSVNGLTGVEPRPVPRAPRPRVLLTRLAWFDGATRRERERRLALGSGTTLTLDPDDEGFTLDYTLTDFADPARHRFRYRLRGLETGWTAAGAAHSLHYARLPAGAYALELRAAGADGRWLPARQVLRVRVIAPFYARWWFITLSFLAVAALVTAAWRYRLRRLRELATVRVRLAADLHDEVGAWLTRVSLHAELARVASPTPEARHQQLEQLSAASRQAIATMSDVVWAVDARNDTLGDLLDRLREQVTQLLEPAGIAFDFHAENLERTRALPPDLRQHLFLIGKEAVHNIVRHSATTRARIFLGNRAGGFELEVADDGPAREPRAAGSRQGLRNMQLRASRLPGATLTVEKGAGYVVRLRLAEAL